MIRRLGEMNRLFATSRDSFLARFELSRPQVELLFSIKHGRRTIGDLADNFSITPSAISQMVTQLEDKSLVRRVPDQKDRRITYVELSSATKDHFTKMRKAILKRLDDRFSDISEREMDQFNNLLEKITKRLDKETN